MTKKKLMLIVGLCSFNIVVLLFSLLINRPIKFNQLGTILLIFTMIGNLFIMIVTIVDYNIRKNKRNN